MAKILSGLFLSNRNYGSKGCDFRKLFKNVGSVKPLVYFLGVLTLQRAHKFRFELKFCNELKICNGLLTRPRDINKY